MQIEWVRFDRERYNPRAFAAVRQGAREGTLAGCRDRPDLHRAAAAQSARKPDRRGKRPAPRIQADQPASPTSRSSRPSMSAPSKPSNPTARRWSTTTMWSRSIASSKPASIRRSRSAGILTEVAGFANTPALLGSVELVEGNTESAIAIVHAFVENQGDGWTVTSAYLDRFVDEQRLLAASEHPGESEEQVPYLRYMSQAGRRVAEMHLALAGTRRIRRFCAGADDARGRAALDRGCDGPRRARLRRAEAAARCDQGSRSPAGRSGAGAARRPARPPERAACRPISTA